MEIPYKLKKFIGISFASIIPLCVFITAQFMGFNVGIALFYSFISIFIATFLALAIIHHALFEVIEANGLLTISLNSTGVSKIYNTRVLPNMRLALKVNGKWYSQLYNRTIGWYIDKVEKAHAKNMENGLCINLPDEAKAINTWRFEGRPFLIWNEKTQTFLDKETVAHMENTIMTENLSLGVLTQVTQLREDMRQFTRHFADLFNPSMFGEMMGSPWFKLIMVLIVGAIIATFAAPYITEAMGGAGAAAIPGGGKLFGP